MEMDNKVNDWENSNKENRINDQVTSSDEEDGNNEVERRRTYECNYCKRGFTNAQALGGHMNIHRKEKAKAKHYPSFSSYSSCPSRSYSNEEATTYISNLTPQRNYYQPYNYPLANPRSSQPSIYNDFPIGRSSLFGMYKEHLGTDLSLRISSSRATFDHQDDEGKQKEDEKFSTIDLELRLGYDP